MSNFFTSQLNDKFLQALPSSFSCRVKNLKGLRVGRLLVVGFAGYSGGKGYSLSWYCLCDCGSIKKLRGSHLKSRATNSCGCLQNHEERSKRTTKHGYRRESLYPVWLSAKDRCNNPNNSRFKSYGGRGITMQESWQTNYSLFHDYCFAMGYRKGLTMDRIDNDGNYEEGNIRFIPPALQAQNKRSNILVEIVEGELLCLAEATRRYSELEYDSVKNRVRRGWDLKRAVLAPWGSRKNG